MAHLQLCRYFAEEKACIYGRCWFRHFRYDYSWVLSHLIINYVKKSTNILLYAYYLKQYFIFRIDPNVPIVGTLPSRWSKGFTTVALTAVPRRMYTDITMPAPVTPPPASRSPLNSDLSTEPVAVAKISASIDQSVESITTMLARVGASDFAITKTHEGKFGEKIMKDYL